MNKKALKNKWFILLSVAFSIGYLKELYSYCKLEPSNKCERLTYLTCDVCRYLHGDRSKKAVTNFNFVIKELYKR